MQRNVVPFEDAAAAVVAGLCILALGFGIAVSLKRVYLSGILAEVMQSTVKISAMVFVILLGASVFSLVFRGLGGGVIGEDVLKTMPGGAFGATRRVDRGRVGNVWADRLVPGGRRK